MPSRDFDYHDLEQKILAPYAAFSADSGERLHDEPEHPYRSPFQRDRDRIIHSSAFRRLEGKTQVFIIFEGDYYRNRLTHTIEVAQISRTIARALRLNEELAEAVALAHDLGHSPFGHVGESVLDEIMKDHGGFEHNRQSLRVVDLLESRYPGFTGLNLTGVVREGIMKHHTDYDKPGDGISGGNSPALEAQIVNVADEITYTCHDLDDGLKSGILKEEALNGIEMPGKVMGRMEDHPVLSDSEKMRRYQIVRRLIDSQVTALLENTAARIEELGIASLADVRAHPGDIVSFDDSMAATNLQMRRFLYENFYRHPRVVESTGIARNIITGLFELFSGKFELIPEDIRSRAQDDAPERVVCDYIAGMTDRFAMNEYEKYSGDL